ncbi:MAG TPA: hypothetical protein VFC44_01930 [Candidatus Saccharimonadales bacterium]|nr:hypothetical protein [Candidatus Saccharimonadales bacterium]
MGRTARQAILAELHGAAGGSGEIDCPICKAGKLRYNQPVNGRITARCSTGGCMSWTE